MLLERIAHQLKLQVFQEKETITEDGSRHLAPYVGPVRISFANRECIAGALVLGDEVLLGAIPMEDMDLVVISKTLTLAVNPAYSDAAHGYAK